MRDRAQYAFDQVETEFFAAAEINKALAGACSLNLQARGKCLQLLIVKLAQAADAAQTGNIGMVCAYHELSMCKLNDLRHSQV